MTRAEIVAAIRKAARELGRAPSRGELKRLTGMSHYRVLTEFRTLREAIRAAGLEPSPKGERVATEDLIKDWERVRKKLGRRPSRAEYVREGRYSAGTFVMRFGSWSGISTTEATEEHQAKASRESTRRTRIELPKNPKSKNGTTESAECTERNRMRGAEKAIAFQWAASHPVMPKPGMSGTPVLAKIPGPLEGKRRVTEAVAKIIVNTLMPAGANSNWQLAIGQNQNPFTTEGTENHRGGAERAAIGHVASRSRMGQVFPLRSSVRSVVKKDRPVMGAPFSRHPLTNAPVNEMGVVFLFALVAWDLGFQVESLWARGYPDGRAKREVAPGKWQDVAIEFEYESKNFVLHGHDEKKCDVIVCWRHNWKECPEEIEVIELSGLFG